MPKDFNDYIREKNALLKKREVEIEKEVFEKNYEIQLSQVIFGNVITTAVLNLLTQPFNVMSTQLQLSSNPIENFKIDVKQIMESQYTIQQKRRLELVHKQFKPYPYYPSQFLNYRKALLGIAEQGIMGFFKGYKSGVLYSVLNSQFRFLILYKLNNENKIIQNLLVAGVATLADLITSPIQAIQTRLILQNRLPNFKTYHNFRQIIRSGGLMQGASGHIYKNIFIGLTQIPAILIDNQRITLIYMISTSLIFGYPFLTLIRRLQAQSKDMNMINTNYSGFLDVLKETYNNRGILKLYKGFGAYATVNMFISSVLYSTQIFGEQYE